MKIYKKIELLKSYTKKHSNKYSSIILIKLNFLIKNAEVLKFKKKIIKKRKHSSNFLRIYLRNDRFKKNLLNSCIYLKEYYEIQEKFFLVPKFL